MSSQPENQLIPFFIWGKILDQLTVDEKLVLGRTCKQWSYKVQYYTIHRVLGMVLGSDLQDHLEQMPELPAGSESGEMFLHALAREINMEWQIENSDKVFENIALPSPYLTHRLTTEYTTVLKLSLTTNLTSSLMSTITHLPDLYDLTLKFPRANKDALDRIVVSDALEFLVLESDVSYAFITKLIHNYPELIILSLSEKDFKKYGKELITNHTQKTIDISTVKWN